MTKTKAPTPLTTENANVAVDPQQLPVEVPLEVTPSVPALIALSGFEQLAPVFRATAAWIRAFHLGGRTLTMEEHDELDASVALMRRTIKQMTPEG